MYDFLHKSSNTIIEYQGDLYHANPRLFNDEDCPNPFKKDLTTKEIRAYDMRKHATVKDKGYNVIVVWDSEYKNNPKKW